MTSRSEYRLLLRQDNADLRLTQMGRDVGLIDDERYEAFLERRRITEEEKERLEKTTASPTAANPMLEKCKSTPISTGAKLADLLRRPEVDYASLAQCDRERQELPERVCETVETEIKYEGYIKRQLSEAEKQKKIETKLLPADIDYTKIKGLRLEAAAKLQEMRPATLGQAARISGVNPADISVLVIYLSLK